MISSRRIFILITYRQRKKRKSNRAPDGFRMRNSILLLFSFALSAAVDERPGPATGNCNSYFSELAGAPAHCEFWNCSSGERDRASEREREKERVHLARLWRKFFNNAACQKRFRQRHRHLAPANITLKRFSSWHLLTRWTLLQSGRERGKERQRRI